MDKYKVKVLGVQGINKKVYGPGEIVTEKNFPEGNAEKLVEEGKLEPVTNKERKEAEEKTFAAEEQKKLEAEEKVKAEKERKEAEEKARKDREANKAKAK